MTDLGPLTLGRLGSEAGSRPVESPADGGPSERRLPTDSASPGAMLALIEETVLIYRRLGAVAQEMHRQGSFSGVRRNVLRELDRLGPQTVPQLARRRSVTRQHVQALVNPLAEAGYVELIDNPAHKRSRLVRLTPDGKDYVDEMIRREIRLLGELDVSLTERELQRAASVLKVVREAL
jgi:DNA-binding MarR family transcriptional regulator